MLKNIFYFGGSVIIFFAGMVIYGIILNTREVTLKEALIEKNLTEINNAVLIVEKHNHKLYLYDDTMFVKTYKVVLGRSSSDKRLSLKNNNTPTGQYKVCDIDTTHKYHKFFRINHPNVNDVVEALREGIITTEEYNAILQSESGSDCPETLDIFTPVIGIHGIGEYDFIFKNLPFIFDWTNGSIAMSNDSIDELASIISIGTKIIIR